MFKTVIAVLFVFVLSVDFVIEVSRKEVRAADLLIRGFMILAWAYLTQGM